MIVNIRGTSGSGKSTLVKRFLDGSELFKIEQQLGPWKKPKVVVYGAAHPLNSLHTFVVGRYETACGGCDALSYKGSHDDIEKLVRYYGQFGNVIFEGLTISSTITRWRRVADDFPGRYTWAFMSTPLEVCHERILSRSGGREPKIRNGWADYQLKHRGCLRHLETLRGENEKVLELTSDDQGYQALLSVLE